MRAPSHIANCNLSRRLSRSLDLGERVVMDEDRQMLVELFFQSMSDRWLEGEYLDEAIYRLVVCMASVGRSALLRRDREIAETGGR